MSTPLSRVITNEIFRVPARRKRKPEVKPSDIPTFKDYTARLVDQKWLFWPGAVGSVHSLLHWRQRIVHVGSHHHSIHHDFANGHHHNHRCHQRSAA